MGKTISRKKSVFKRSMMSMCHRLPLRTVDPYRRWGKRKNNRRKHIKKADTVSLFIQPLKQQTNHTKKTLNQSGNTPSDIFTTFDRKGE